MSDPKFPIFIFDGLDLMISTSYKRLQGDIEPIDIRLGDHEVFDSDGRRVKLETHGWSGTDAKVDLKEPAANEEFSQRLRDYLRAVNHPVADNPECDLPCLIEAAKRRA
jgi:hypothetical protein